MANGKKKGSKNERAVAAFWQEITGLEFSRVPASGGLRWQKKDDITGDIICTDPRKSRRFPFSIECKSYAAINFEHLILGNKKQRIIEFWDQAKEDGLRAKRIPILFMRYNMMPKDTWFVIIHKTIWKLAMKHGLKYAESAQFHITMPGQEDFVIMYSEDFKKIDLKKFMITCKKYRRKWD